MEKKWWYICGVQAQLLLIVLWFTPAALAKSSVPPAAKKGKIGTVSKTQGGAASAKKTTGAASTERTAPTKRRTQAKAASSPASRRSPATLSARKEKVRDHQKTGKRVGSRKSQGEKKYQSLRASSRTKNGKKLVAVTSSRKALRVGKSTKAAKSRRSASRRWGMRTTVAAADQGFSLQMRGASAVRREVIARNYEGVDVSAPYSPELSPFPIQVNNERLFHRVNSVFVLPGENLTFNAGHTQETNEYVLQTAHYVARTAPNTWSWKAPQSVGLYPIKIQHPRWDAPIQLNVFVMAPFSAVEGGYLNGYQIGHYPTTASRPLSTPTLPRGFIEVTEENEHTYVSPHFRLRQFLCKQDGDYPKYLALDSRLLIVLEAILQKVNEQGHHSPTLSIMSGYRTPYYNRAIGNSTTYSRHLWGDAADIFVDAHPLDGEMDDLNRDGVVNIHDTEVLYDIVAEMYAPRVKRFLAGSFFNEPILQQLVVNGYADDARIQKLLTGGLARYRETGSHGPFVHVDVRGVFTRW